jgi:hypothetical protein
MSTEASEKVVDAQHEAYHTSTYAAAGAAMMRWVDLTIPFAASSLPITMLAHRWDQGISRGRPCRRIVQGASKLRLMYSFQPINQIHQHLCAFHVYSHDPSRAVRAHHFCTHLRSDLCVVYDSDQPGARLIGELCRVWSQLAGYNGGPACQPEVIVEANEGGSDV